MQTIGILGSGVVAQALGNGFLKHGFQVKLGTSNPDKLSDWKSKAGVNGTVGSFEQAASFGEIVVLAVKGTTALEAIEKANASFLSGKTVIDTTNPIADAPPENGVLKFFTDLNQSLMEKLQKAYPEINFVKAFNSVGSHLMVNPNFTGGKPSMFICGNNQNAKDDVKTILDKFDWETLDMGLAESARAIEPLCMLWCIPGFRYNQWAHAFKLLKMN